MRHLFLFFFFCFLLSCTEDELTTPDSMLAIEGWIENGGYPVVMVTKTLSIGSEEYNLNNLQDYIVKWAKVSVIHNKDTVVLIGKYDKGYFPPYIYTTGRMRGKVGETYKLLVEYKGLYATAITTIPSPPKVERYKVEKCADSDTLYQIKACMDLTDHPEDYYQFFVKVGSKRKQYLAAFLGYLDSSSSKQTVEFPVYRGHEAAMLNQGRPYTPYYLKNDTVAVKCCKVDKIGYDFWKTYNETEYLSGAAILATTSNLPTNIVGGTGYWFGYGATTSYFIIKDYVK